MTPKEVRWCLNQIDYERQAWYAQSDFIYADDGIAARAWKSSQIRRLKKVLQAGLKRYAMNTHTWVAYKWSWRKFRFDKYILGFNYWYHD